MIMILKTNIYEMNTKLFASLKLNIINITDMVLIDKFMNSTNEEGEILIHGKF